MASKIKVDQLETVDGTGNITVNQPLSGSGAGLTSLPAANLTGTIADARFPATLPATSGANLTALPAANITGVIPAANLGTGSPSSTTFLNGSGAYSAAGGGDFIRLGGATFSGVTEVVISPTGFDMDYAVSTGYDAYKLFFTCDNSNATARFYVSVSEDGGSSWQQWDTSPNANGYCQIGYGKDSGGSLDSNEYNLGAFWIGHDLVSDNDAEALWHVEITMIKPLAEAKPFTAHMQFTYYEGDNANTNGANMAWASHYTNAVDGIRLYPNGEGTIKGYWTMYGLKS